MPSSPFTVTPRRRAVLVVQGMRHAFDVPDTPGRRELLHLRDRSRRATKVGATMHEREACSLRRELDGPVQRGVTAAEYDEALPMQQVRIPYAIADVLAFEGIGPFETDPARLERTDARRQNDCAGIECSTRSGT